jgi:hypothetical protein
MEPKLVQVVACGVCGHVFTEGSWNGETSEQLAAKCCRCDGCGGVSSKRRYYRAGQYYCDSCSDAAELRSAKAHMKRMEKALAESRANYFALRAKLHPNEQPKPPVGAPNFDDLA